MRSFSKYILLFLFILFIYALQRISILSLGYEMENLKKDLQTLEQTHNSLLLEKASLESAERIEKLATSYLGLKKPEYDQIVFVKEDKGKDVEGPLYASVSKKGGNFLYPLAMVKFINWRH